MSQRKQSYTCSDTVVVLFDGAKSFWKTRTNLDILIIEHSKHMCIEVIAFNAALQVEAPRIYLSSLLLGSKIDQAEVREKLTEKKEALIRMKKNVNVNELTKEIMVGMLTQFILSRLSIPADQPAGGLTVLLLPNSGDKVVDEATQRMDIVCEKPGGLVPLDVAYQKRVTASDFQTAMSQLQSESVALKQATNMAELATSSVDGFKLVLAERMRIELELKRRCSAPRLRWIKAINRVLIQNYITIVRARLDRMAADEALRAEEAEALAAVQGGGRKARPKVLRRSIDNSQFNRLPSLKQPGGPAEGVSLHIAPHDAPHGKEGGHLPVLSPSAAATGLVEGSARRRGRAVSIVQSSKNDRAGLTRKSFGQEHYPQYASKSERLPARLLEPEAAADPLLHLQAGPPSLLKSYASMSNKVLQPLSLSAAAGSERSVRLLQK